MSERAVQRLIFAGAGLFVLLALAAGTMMWPPIVRWPVLGGSIAMAILLFTGATTLRADGDSPIEWLDTSIEPGLPDRASGFFMGTTRTVMGWAILVLSAVGNAIFAGLITVIVEGRIHPRAVTPIAPISPPLTSGFLWALALVALVGFVLPLAFLRPERA